MTRRRQEHPWIALAMICSLVDVTACINYNDAQCDSIEEPHAPCAAIAITSAPKRFDRGTVQKLSFAITNLAPQAEPSVELSSGAVTKQLTPKLHFDPSSSKWQTSLDKPFTDLPIGVATLSVHIGRRAAQAEMGSTMIYTSPQLNPSPPPPAELSGQRILSIQLQPMPGDTKSSIFVAQEKMGTPIMQSLNRYTWQGDTPPMLDATFSTKPNLTVAVSAKSTALFSVNQDSAFVYRDNGIKRGLAAVDLATASAQTDSMVILQAGKLLASEPSRKFHVLWGKEMDDSAKSNLELFRFGTGTGVKAEHVPIPMPALGPETGELSLLAAASYTFDGQQLDFATLNKSDPSKPNNVFKLYSVMGPTITSLDTLSSHVHQPDDVPDWTKAQIDAMTIADIDQDGMPDLVLAIENLGCESAPVGSIICSLCWLPYLRGGSFDKLQSVKLPTSLTAAAVGIAVGDVNGDGKPDVALATGSAFYIYRNNAM